MGLTSGRGADGKIKPCPERKGQTFPGLCSLLGGSVINTAWSGIFFAPVTMAHPPLENAYFL